MFTLNLMLTGNVQAQVQQSAWLASFNTIKTGTKTSIHFDAQLRSTDQWQQVQTLLIRPGLNYHLSNHLILSIGYAYIGNRRNLTGVSGLVTEHRSWEQVLYNHSWKYGLLSHRLRFEQRFLPQLVVENNELETDGFTAAGRIRYFFRHLAPFQRKQEFNKGFFAALQNEIFVNLINRYKVNGKHFDQNRFYLALGYRLQAKFDLEAGYMNQYVQGSGRTFSNNHILQLAGYLRL